MLFAMKNTESFGEFEIQIVFQRFAPVWQYFLQSKLEIRTKYFLLGLGLGFYPKTSLIACENTMIEH